VIVLPLNDPVRVALTAAVVELTEAMKVALICPGTTATPVGTRTVVLLLDSDTSAPLVGADALIVTVQVTAAGPVTVAGLQLNPTK